MTKGNKLEKSVNKVNLVYRKTNEALILKVPVPILYTAKGLIADKSTVDYNGLIKGGTFIAFDCKECKSKTSFPLANIHQHQLVYLDLVKALNGLAFFMIHMTSLHEQVYITPIDIIKNAKKKSIPISDFKDTWLTNVDTYIQKVIELKNEL